MLTQHDLDQFTGTDIWYRHPLNSEMFYTEGVQYFAEAGGAYWLLDIIATEIFQLLRKEAFISIRVDVKDGKAKITADDGGKGDGPVLLYTRDIEYTDLPEGEWKFFLTNDVLLLPSEY